MESSLDLRDLEQFTDKKRWKTRQRDGINRYDSNNLSASEEVQSSLGRSMKYGTFGNSSFSVFGIDIDIQFDKDICCGNCREGRREKKNGVLERDYRKYLIDQIEILRKDIKAKKKSLIICLLQNYCCVTSKTFLIQMFKLINGLIKLITKLFSKTPAYRDHVLKKIVTI